MGWLKRRWQSDEEEIARMQSRYAADEDQDLARDKKSSDKDDKSKEGGQK